MSAMQTLTFACNLTSLNISLRKKVSKDNFEGHVGIPEESTAINWKFQNLVRILSTYTPSNSSVSIHKN